MAANDLMMKIQLLVDSGKSTAELNRLHQSLKTLTSDLRTLENTRLKPVADSIATIKRAADTLKTVNLSNFAGTLDSVKKAFVGLGVSTANLANLRAAYQRLNAQLGSPNAANFIAQIKQTEQTISNLRSNSLIPLQNDIRALGKQKGLDKALGMDSLSASTRVATAQAASLRNEISKLIQKKASQRGILSQGDSQQLSAYRTQLQGLKDTIAKNNVDLANTNKNITDQYNNQIATKSRDLALAQNSLNVETNKLKTLKGQLQAESAKEAVIRKEIAGLTRLATADASAKRVSLQQQLGTVQAQRADLTRQIRETELARVNAIQRQSNALGGLGRQLGQTGRQASQFNAALAFMFGPQMAGFFTASAIYAALSKITSGFFEANIALENLQRGLNAIGGGNGAALFDQLVDSSNKLGVPLKDVSRSFLELQAATRGTQFEGERTRGIFEALANALTITGADSVQFNRGFRALTQILSKGQLYAEELRQQMGEALPSAIQDFSKALNISPKELFQFMQAGVIEGDNLYRTLALVEKQWKKTYKQANEGDFTFTQKAAVAQNAINLLFVEIGNTGIWKAFGNGLLYVRDRMVELRSEVQGVSIAVKENARYWQETINSIDFSGIDINADAIGASLKASLAFILQSIADVPNNIKTLVQVATNEFVLFSIEMVKYANDLGLPIQEAFDRTGAYIKSVWQDVSNNANLIFTVMNVGFRELFYVPVLELISLLKQSIASVFASMASGFDAIGMFSDVSQQLKTIAESWKNSDVGVDEQKAKIEALKKEFVDLKAKVNLGLDPILAQNLSALENKYRDLKKAQEEQYNARKASAQQGIDDALAENAARKQQRDTQIALNKALAEQDAIAKRDRGSRNEILISTAKAQTLRISKEQAKVDKEILDLRQAFKDTMQDINASKYQKWADSGQITQEAADFLIASAKGDAAWKAWQSAQEAVAAYNAEAAKGSAAEQKTLEALKQQADDQLKYAGAKAKEVGDEYRIKQILEEQIALRERQKALTSDFNKVLTEAEGGKPVEQPVKPVLEPVPTKLDPAEQQVNRTYDDPITRLPDAIQWVNRVYTGASPGSSSGFARGGLIPGGYSNRDSVSAMLAPGEFVIPSGVVRALSPSFFYDLIRNRGVKIPTVSARDNISVPHFAAGGLVQNSMQPIVINVGSKAIQLSGSREAANQLVKLLTQTGRAL